MARNTRSYIFLLDEGTRMKLRIMARHNHRSSSAELRHMINDAWDRQAVQGLAHDLAEALARRRPYPVTKDTPADCDEEE